MKNVYKVTYDVRIGRTWITEQTRNVLANGDARKACDVIEREEKKIKYDDGRRANAVRITAITRVANDVL